MKNTALKLQHRNNITSTQFLLGSMIRIWLLCTKIRLLCILFAWNLDLISKFASAKWTYRNHQFKKSKDQHNCSLTCIQIQDAKEKQDLNTKAKWVQLCEVFILHLFWDTSTAQSGFLNNKNSGSVPKIAPMLRGPNQITRCEDGTWKT